MIDPRERYADPEELLRTAWDGFQAGIWTALPAIIQSYDASKLTVSVQPAILGNVQNSDGTTTQVKLPLIQDVPVVFPRGGQCTLTFPIGANDECLLVFASRCIDAWWQSGGTQAPVEGRMHDLSDAFCIPGPFSQKAKISNVSTSTVQLRSNDGSTYVELDPAGQIVKVKAPGGMKIDADVTITGDVTASGTMTGQTEVQAGNATKVKLSTHIHTGVASGTGTSGPPKST